MIKKLKAHALQFQVFDLFIKFLLRVLSHKKTNQFSFKNQYLGDELTQLKPHFSIKKKKTNCLHFSILVSHTVNARHHHQHTQSAGANSCM